MSSGRFPFWKKMFHPSSEGINQSEAYQEGMSYQAPC